MYIVYLINEKYRFPGFIYILFICSDIYAINNNYKAGQTTPYKQTDSFYISKYLPNKKKRLHNKISLYQLSYFELQFYNKHTGNLYFDINLFRSLVSR